jgi:germination protein YpeB
MFKKRAVLAIIVSIIIIVSTTFGTLMFLDRRDYRIFLSNQYQRNLYDVISNVEALQVALSKATITASPRQSLILFSEIWRLSSTAQDKLNALPISHIAISQTSKYLSQVADFGYTLLKVNNNGGKISEAEWSNVDKLRDYAGYLSTQLHQLEQELSEGKVEWGEIKRRASSLFQRADQNSVDVKFQSIAQEMQQYPTLIYDGPFSENILNIKPKILSQPEISIDKAKETAQNVIGKDVVESISVYSDKSGETVPSYALSVKRKGSKNPDINIDISKNGGQIVFLLDERDIKETKIDIKTAIQHGTSFLENMGYKGMIPTYTLKYDNIVIVNYVLLQNKVVVYPDQIKLKIALDNGSIVGVEAQHYLVAHETRTIPKPKITPEKAAKNVSQKLSIDNIRLSIIPMESTREVLCYEFYGNYNGEKYIVYINAVDGTEERILKVLETPNGELTM